MTVRVHARAGVDGLVAGEWADVPDGAHLSDLLAMGLVSLVGPHGEPAPEEIPRRRCCG